MGPRGGKMLASNILQRANDLGEKKPLRTASQF